MPLGAHVSTAGGLSTCVGRAQDLAAECMQVFLSAPQRWQHPKHTDEQVDAFTGLLRAVPIGPNFAHAVYLINLATADPTIRQRSIDNLVATVSLAERLGLSGVVVHVGSGRGQSIEDAEVQVASALGAVLRATSSGRVLLENAAGSGVLLGSRFQQIGELLKKLDNDPRLALCLDTAHTFASGYDLRAPSGIDQTVEEIDRCIGLDRLRLIHANDSKVGLGSAVDRHENIGRGSLGEATFEKLLAHLALKDVPWVLEVPGYDDKGPDRQNLDDLKRLAGRLPAR